MRSASWSSATTVPRPGRAAAGRRPRRVGGQLRTADRAGDHRTADLTIAVLPAQQTADGSAAGGFGLVMTTASRGIAELTGWTPRAPLSGQRCLTRRAFELASPLAAGWGMEVGMTVDMLRAGLRIEEIEIELRHRATGTDLASQLHRAKQLRDVTRALAAREPCPVWSSASGRAR